jgi:hypothetical protein
MVYRIGDPVRDIGERTDAEPPSLPIGASCTDYRGPQRAAKENVVSTSAAAAGMMPRDYCGRDARLRYDKRA